jgi:hypothetical protein
MNSSANQISPVSHRRDLISRVAIFQKPAGSPKTPWKIPSGPPPVANMPSTGRFAQGGKLDCGEAKGSGFEWPERVTGSLRRRFSVAEKFESADPAVAR